MVGFVEKQAVYVLYSSFFLCVVSVWGWLEEEMFGCYS